MEKQKCLVIGAAKSGCSVARLLNDKGFEVLITDMHLIEERKELESKGIQVIEGEHPTWLSDINYAFVVKNPGIKYTVPFIASFVEKGVKIYTEVEVASWYAPNFHYAAVSGTNGKTTITSMLYACLKEKGQALVGGNIGTPLSELVIQYGEEEKDVAIELSNFQLLGCESFHPLVSVVCNLAPDHLDYMKSVEEYYESKMRIYQKQENDDWFLRNVDDEVVMQYAKNIKGVCIDFSMKRLDVDLYIKEGVVYLRDMLLFDSRILKVVGAHNQSNAMIAACMAYKLGVSVAQIQKALSGFNGIEHRIEYIGESKGIKFYNDSKATNTQAAAIALASFDNNILLLAGGHDKGIPFDEMGEYDERVKCCFAFGESKTKIAKLFTRHECVENLSEAIHAAYAIAKTGDVILLSPACSSYDQFNNYEERGDLFREEALKIIKGVN